ncbi:hypothetical protein NMK34_23785 [Micromonospora sp. BRA006-A]|uniref:hypothetical protein n=1 Tax=Micromonospora sp. BRA006-A TaxID=2962860 RepID=UPI00296F4260|nr:hypothetical protein [Micromonospora sp. BRA006-A]MDW3849639.1 hypothetical protein [Micromonospora sp. BRA006-A]
MDPIFWVLVFAWMLQRGVTDGLYAYRGKPNPRYELKKARAQAAGQPTPAQPRYMTGDWFKDLYSDALVANTDKRRAKVKAKAQPVDDMVDVAGVRPTESAREEREPEWLTPDPDELDGSEPVVHDDTSTSRANAGKWSWSCRRPGCPGKGFDYDTEDQARAGAAAHRCKDTDSRPAEGVQILGGNKPAPTANPVPEPTPAGEQPKLATVIPMFPILKEPTMSNAEITGLPTAIAFAQGMASAHRAASTAGGEQYVAALRSFEVGDGTIATVATARELSAQAAAAWERAAAEIGKQNTVKEAYQAVPDAGNKRFVTGE